MAVHGQEGVAFTYKGKVLLFLASGDLDTESGQSLNSAAQSALNNLKEALQAREDERRWPVIRTGVLYTLFGLALLVGFLWVVWKASRSPRQLPVPRPALTFMVFAMCSPPPAESTLFSSVAKPGWRKTAPNLQWFEVPDLFRLRLKEFC